MMLISFLRGLTESRESHVIYANRLEAGIVGAALSRITGKPLVMSLTSDEADQVRYSWIWRAAAKWVIRRAAIIVPVSKEVLDILRQLGVPETKCHLPRFGVDMEMFHPPGTGSREQDQVRLLFVGSLIERKGLHDLIEALGDPVFERVELLVAGEGTEQPRLAALSEKVGAGHRVRWLGPRPQAEVAELMRSVDLFCLPSHMEGRPNVVYEAMASGLPVIASAVGGIPEMVREGETAFLFEPGNRDQLKACLTKLVAHADLRHAMGAAGYTYLVQSRVMWNSLAEEFDALFSSLAPGSN
jgi:glycosyltransferase involved in cell wall biosynthesis